MPPRRHYGVAEVDFVSGPFELSGRKASEIIHIKLNEVAAA
jgi:hypothetical protein